MSGAGVETCCGGGGGQAAASSGPPPRGLIVVSAVFLSIFLATFLTLMSLAFCCCRRWRERDAVSGYVDGEGAVVVVAAGESGGGEPFPVEALPLAYAYVVRSSEDGGATATAASGGGRECAVCLGAVREGEMVRRLPACEHVYHADCIDRWLAAHRTCPLCRRELDPGKLAAGAPPAPTQQQVDPTDRLPV
uniref:RING-type E3 ubiquitin transferase n=1 Tax=Oryza meridionalis TaxID=40149 RepID=A0A0E0E2L5_9ORYZ